MALTNKRFSTGYTVLRLRAPTDGIEERLLSQVFLQIAQFIATHGKLGLGAHGNRRLAKWRARVDECVVSSRLVPTAHNTRTIGIRGVMVCGCSPCADEFLYSGRLCSGPTLYIVQSAYPYPFSFPKSSQTPHPTCFRACRAIRYLRVPSDAGGHPSYRR